MKKLFISQPFKRRLFFASELKNRHQCLPIFKKPRHLQTRPAIFNSLCIIYFAACLVIISSCTKQEIHSELTHDADTEISEQYLNQIQRGLKDSLYPNDFNNVDFNEVYKCKDASANFYYLRAGIINKKLSSDFILLETDSNAHIIQGRIIHAKGSNLKETSFNNIDTVFVITNLHNKAIHYVNSGNISNVVSKTKEQPVGEQKLPDVVVVGYIYTEPFDWFFYEAFFEAGTGIGSSTGGSTYTYGSADPKAGSGGTTKPLNKSINLRFENADQPLIALIKYLKCFSNVSDQNATYKMTIFADIPVNSDPDQLFNFRTGACGHTFLQLTKSSGGTSVTQNIGFYPESGWKSIEANAPVASKLVDNAGHEFNASLAVNIDATHFQMALNEMEYNSSSKYDIDNFNCTDFALSVFNVAAPLYLSIPEYHIPGGMVGELSNTPQGLYAELSSLQKSGKYPQGQITIPGVCGYVGNSHGACN